MSKKQSTLITGKQPISEIQGVSLGPDGRDKQEVHDALLTYMQVTGATITQRNIQEFDISDEQIEGCHKFYEKYMKRSKYER